MMSVLKLHGGLRVVNPQYLACTPVRFVGSLEEGKAHSPKQHASTFSKRFRTGDSNKTGKLPDNGNSPSSPADKIEKLKGSLAAFGSSVPHKMAELNKFLTEYIATTSKKLTDSSKTLTAKKWTDKSKPGIEKPARKDSVSKSRYEAEPPNCDNSFEDNLNQMNQSIVSFYDTSCATNLLSAPAPVATHVALKKPPTAQDSLDDETSYRSQTIGPLFPTNVKVNTEAKKKRAEERRAQKISRLSLESRTKSLVRSLRSAHSLMSKITRAEELCEHLINHPECVWDANSEKAVRCLKGMTKSPDKILRGLAYQNLSLLGYAKPLTSPGIRILSIDGGGTRGLVTIEFLKALEKQTGRKAHQLFDYVCGVSTGALLAILVCLYKLPLDRCENLYKECAIKMFTQSKVRGTTKLVFNHDYYDSHAWEDLLKKEMGEEALVEFARDSEVPKLSAVSSLVGSNKLINHMFRTYNPPPGATSQYTGSCRHKCWEVVRASSAAPGYFASFKLGDMHHEDGGVLTNNPTALAIHEAKLLWPTEQLHCVVSLGTGRYESSPETSVKMSLSLKQKITTIIESATDTEAVHMTLQDLLPARTYFRFNPYLSDEVLLDEIRPEKMVQMQHDAQMYTRRNSYKLTAVSNRLMEKRKPQQVAIDWMKKLVDEM